MTTQLFGAKPLDPVRYQNAMRRLIAVVTPTQYAILMLMTIGLVAPVHAEVMVGESLDWLTIARPHIAIVEVTATDPENKTEAKYMALTIKTRRRKVLKGQPPGSAEFVREWQMSARPGEEDSARPENGIEYLVFFDEQGKVTNAMNLVFPSQNKGIGADPRDVALSTGFDILKTREAILQTVELRLDRLKRNPPQAGPVQNAANLFTPEQGFKRAEVPANTPAWKVLWRGSPCYLVIPVEDGDSKAGTKQSK